MQFVVIILIIAIVLQFLLNFLLKNKPKRIKTLIGSIIMVIAIIGIIYNSGTENTKYNYLKNKLDTITDRNLNLESKISLYLNKISNLNQELKNVNSGYDSLTIQNKLLMAELKHTSNRTILELMETNKSMKNLSNASGARIITKDQKLMMISVLSQATGSKIKIEYVFGDNETASYTQQVATVFLKAGWKLYGDAVFGNYYLNQPMKQGVYLEVIKNDPDYKYAKLIIEAFKSVGINVKYKEYKDATYDYPLKIITGIMD